MFLYDFHSHILPGADHGSNGIETTEKQFDIIEKSGVNAIVATPHFYPHAHSVDSFLIKRNSAISSACALLDNKDVELYVGAEVLLCEGIERMEELSCLCIEGTEYMLTEMPFGEWSDNLIETLSKISRMGITPVIAHIDRYPIEFIQRLMQMPDLKFQINADIFRSLCCRRFYKDLIEKGNISAIGSDLHGVRGYDSFLKAIKYIGEANTEKVMCQTAEILKNAKNYNIKEQTDEE